ncbi:DUF3223 domain-containing protein [Mesorhizobium sp. M0586]
MLLRYPANSVVSDVDAIELESLLMRHPDYAEKVGNGIHHFEVTDAEYGTTCFCVIRNNGSRIYHLRKFRVISSKLMVSSSSGSRY